MQIKLFIFVFLLVIAGALATFLSMRNVQGPVSDEQVFAGGQSQNQSISYEAEIVQPETLSLGTFPIGSEPINIPLEKAGVATIRVSWDDTQFNVYYLLIFDVEEFRLHSPKALVWAISSLKEVVLPADGIVTNEDVAGFIPAEYILGELVMGLHTSLEPTDGTLTVGRRYYLQVNGFRTDGEVAIVNKEFTFTGSCVLSSSSKATNSISKSLCSATDGCIAIVNGLLRGKISQYTI